MDQHMFAERNSPHTDSSLDPEAATSLDPEAAPSGQTCLFQYPPTKSDV